MDKAQLEQCIYEYGKDVYTFCSQITGNCQEADDLYQDTFLKATELKEGIDYNRNPRSYFISVALRIWKNRRRKFAWRKRIAGTCTLTEEAAEVNMPEQEISAEDVVLQKELEQQVRKAVGELAEKYRIPVYLYYTLQLSVEEIAKLLHKKASTVRTQLTRARKKLAQLCLYRETQSN